MTGPLVYLHIPKTAGTTFNELLRRSFSSDKSIVSADPRYSDLAAIPNDVLAEAQFVGGHYREYQLARRLPTRTTMVILREPFERFVSLCLHTLRDNSILDGKPYRRDYIAILQQRRFELVIRQSIEWYVEASQTSWLTKYKVAVRSDAKVAAQQAIRTLDQADLVATDKHLNDFYLALAGALEQPDVHVPRMNAAEAQERTRFDIRQSDRELFYELFPWELDVYNHAQGHFSRTMSHLTEPKVIAALRDPRPSARWGINWHAPILATGLSDRTLASSPPAFANRLARFIAQDVCTIMLPRLANGPARLELALWCDPADALLELSISIDGQPCSLETQATVTQENPDRCFALVSLPLPDFAGTTSDSRKLQIVIRRPPSDRTRLVWLLDLAVVAWPQTIAA